MMGAVTEDPPPIRTIAHHIEISREMALDFGLVEPTDEERADREQRARELLERVARDRAQAGPELTLQRLLEFLDWSPAYAAHVLHPACSCDPFPGDPFLCEWARELGFTEVGGDLPS